MRLFHGNNTKTLKYFPVLFFVDFVELEVGGIIQSGCAG